MNHYYQIRGGFHKLISTLEERSCKIAFLGNSITAQKEGYAKLLADKINNLFEPQHEFIFAGLGGIGSMVSCFIMDDFVLRHKPDICFVECTVADIGYATPNHYLKPAIEGIIRKLISSQTEICFLHLYNTHTLPNRIDEIISIYEDIICSYNLPSINLSAKINSLILAKNFNNEDLLYDGVHTTIHGASVYADNIFSAFVSILNGENIRSGISTQQNNTLDKSFKYTQIVLPDSLLNEPSSNVKKCRFRGLIKYIHINNDYIVETTLDEGMIVGFIIVADESSGVLLIEYEDQSIVVQTYDQWCHKERIQAVILEKLVLKSQKLRITMSSLDCTTRGANGSVNNNKNKGSSFKLIGLMTVFDKEPKEKRSLW